MSKNLLMVTLVGVLLFSAFTTAAYGATVAVVLSTRVAQYNEALAGFRNYFSQRNVSVMIKEFDVKQSNLLGQMQAYEPDVIVTMGTSATKTIKSAIDDLPIVFSMVLDPVGNGFTGSNMTGVSLDISPAEQFRKFRSVVPNLSSIGVIYNVNENANAIKKAKQDASKQGITLKAYPVQTTKDIPEINTLGIDALWMIPDGVVCKPAIVEHIFMSSLQYSIPVMGISAAYAKAGAILALAADYNDIGRQTAEITQNILNGSSPASITIQEPEKTKLYLNLTVASRLGINIPNSIIMKADKTYGK
jgi:putative ABC transport system substrate-binding protein